VFGPAPYRPALKTVGLTAFLQWLKGYLRFFFGPLSGRATTAADFFQTLRATAHSVPALAMA